MITLKFKCTLKTDVILNAKSASQGNNKTLDFIPGNVFLGIVAGKLYGKKSNEECSELFHTGSVRFGDAHPASGNIRTLRIPSQFFHDKIRKEDGGLYVHCYMNDDFHKELRNKGIQLKQYRNGFFELNDSSIISANNETSFAIKSAYDKYNLTSKDKKMYGYESLCKGASYYFSVECDKEEYKEDIIASLIGERHVGRSRTAQYGLVEISEFDYVEAKSTGSGKYVTVYADGRLIFIDQCTGLPTFQPTPEDLGVTGGKIRWDLSQIRTFQYSPWNGKRQAFDTDRCGIEKGSVFVIEDSDVCPMDSKYIGAYRNEGFGKVIYNPAFLSADSNGLSHLRFAKKTPEFVSPSADEGKPDESLISLLRKRKEIQRMNESLYKLVNDFVKENWKRFANDAFASQWGTIRSRAMQYHDRETLYNSLFEEEKGYLAHGVAKDKWAERDRLRLLKKSISDAESMDVPMYLFLINLASQMQKKNRNKKQK